MPLTDTLFTQAPGWHWLVVLYFFFGGLSGGSFFLAAMADLFGTAVDRPLARLGYYTALATIIPAAPLLILDLSRPERFWHMMIQSERPPLPIFKWWSPMSVGSWGLLIFSAIVVLMVAGSLAETGRLWQPLKFLRGGIVKTVLALIGGIAAFFIASYTGVLLSVTNRPLWGDSSLLGLLFLISAASTGAALLLLLSRSRFGVAPESVAWLQQMDSWALGLELLALAAFLLSLGAVAQLWLSLWGLGLLLGVVLLGIVLPLLLHWKHDLLGNMSVTAASALVLIGGFLLRTVIVWSSESIGEVEAWLIRYIS